MAENYELIFKNDCYLEVAICLFQKIKNQPADIFSVAWLTQDYCYPERSVKFRWGLDECCATWAETGLLKPGAIFKASAVQQVNPFDARNNTLDFSYSNGGYHFTATKKTTEYNSVGIFPDGSIPNEQVSIGIGMNGQTALVTQAWRNKDFIFNPKVEYYLAWSEYQQATYQQGQVMDLSSSANTIQVKFPVNVYKQSIRLGDDLVLRKTK